MGRRPDPLVGVFFERGEKIADSSNRYQHTCRRCGEHFPKGRLDGLLGHLLRRCPHITLEDRQGICEHYSQRPAPRKLRRKDRERTEDFTFASSHDEPTSEFPTRSSQKEIHSSALDTLAEVSRQQLDYSSQQSLRTYSEQSVQHDLSQLLAENALIVQLQQGVDALAQSETNGILEGREHYGGESSTVHNISQDPADSLPATGLVQTASAANQELEYTQSQARAESRSEISAVDPRLQDHSSPAEAHSPVEDPKMLEAVRSERQTAVTAAHVGNVQALSHSSLSAGGNNLGFGLLQPSTRGKARSKFNDARRKEVHGIRKQGACMRCRMLKKPCSDGTPCNSCRNVSTGRVWTGTCIRTRLSESCQLWSAGLFSSRLASEITHGTLQAHELPLLWRLKVIFPAFSPMSIDFSMSGTEHEVGDAASALGLGAVEDDSLRSVPVPESNDFLQGKVEDYLERVARARIENLGSPFLQSSMLRAIEMSATEQAGSPADRSEKASQQSPRSCYMLQAQLLKNVVELWVANDMLTACNGSEMEVQHDGHSSTENANVSNGESHDVQTNVRKSDDHDRIVRVQILAAVEARCNRLSKIVMNEIEKRLLQRQQISRFATFLSIVVFLNSVERISGFYRTLDRTAKPPQPNGTETNGHTGTNGHATIITDQTWPLNNPASFFWRQGEEFANLLTSLLRVRALAPDLTRTSADTLAVLQEASLPKLSRARPAEGKERKHDDAAREAAEWLDPLAMRVQDLVAKRDAAVPGSESGPEAWDLRFIAKVLLPERM